jgi:hypothetical protein
MAREARIRVAMEAQTAVLELILAADQLPGQVHPLGRLEVTA